MMTDPASAITRFDFRLEFVFLHCSDFLTARPWSLGIKPLSLIARYPSDYSRFVDNPYLTGLWKGCP